MLFPLKADLLTVCLQFSTPESCCAVKPAHPQRHTCLLSVEPSEYYGILLFHCNCSQHQSLLNSSLKTES